MSIGAISTAVESMPIPPAPFFSLCDFRVGMAGFALFFGIFALAMLIVLRKYKKKSTLTLVKAAGIISALAAVLLALGVLAISLAVC